MLSKNDEEDTPWLVELLTKMGKVMEENSQQTDCAIPTDTADNDDLLVAEPITLQLSSPCHPHRLPVEHRREKKTIKGSFFYDRQSL